MQKVFLTSIVLISLFITPFQSEAGWLFHATKRAAANRIYAQGFSHRMNPAARFGKGLYFSKSPVTALREKPGANAIVKSGESKMLMKNTINTKKMSTAELKKFTGDKDLRGKIHHGIIGPKLGHEIGNKAGASGKAVQYQSARDPLGSNTFVPAQVYQKHPGIVHPEKVISYGR